jgi:hypothetical protein
MSGHGKNTALRGLLDEAEMSNVALGRAVVAAGAREGKHLGGHQHHLGKEDSVSPEDAALFYTVNGFGGDLGKCLSGIGIPIRPSRSARWRCVAVSPGWSAACV